MKHMKKITAIILILIITVSICAITVSAAPESAATGTASSAVNVSSAAQSEITQSKIPEMPNYAVSATVIVQNTAKSDDIVPGLGLGIWILCIVSLLGLAVAVGIWLLKKKYS